MAATLKWACIMIDEEKLYDVEMFAKIQKHLAWMAVHQPNVLGDGVNEMAQFTADKSLDAIANLNGDDGE
jgi:hypothetical protein